MKIHLFIAFAFFFNGYFCSAQNIQSEQSQVSFEISNMGFNTVEGSFKGMKGTVDFRPQDLSNSNFNVCVDATTVNTGNSTRDKHLRNEKHFEVEKYPTICFVSSTVTQSNSGYITQGKLTMHGITKEVEIPFTYSNQQFLGEITVDRLDYGIGPKGGFMMGRTVDLEIKCVVE
ncbi:MAG: YceI family protein [Chitinophagales bacterium]